MDITGLFQSAITIVLFFAILGGLVLIHEIGHFVTARLYNVRVLEFGIGFPPRAKVLANRGETLYTLNWLPIGGFVKLEGEDGEEPDDPRSFAHQGLGRKLIILVAGVVMNLVLAFVTFTGIAFMADTAIGVRFGEVVADSPAASAGLVAGDTLVAIDGQRYSAFGGRLVIDDLQDKAGQPVTLTIQHADGTTEDVTVTLRVPAPGQGALGIAALSAAQIGRIEHGFVDAVQLGAQRTVEAFGLILGGLAELGRSIVTDPTTAPPAAGPVGIAVQIGDVLWGLGPVFVLYLAGILSANLALVNILPFPPLDGGRMAVLLLKRVAGERISLRAERMTYFVGFVVLFAFLIWITAFDLARVGGVIE